MKTKIFSRRFLVLRAGALVMGLALTLVSHTARAELGGTVASVHNDQVAMKASIRITNAASYTVHELAMPAGVIVREFVSGTGQVFGVAWAGPANPDLRQVLGTYFDQYQQVRQQMRAPRGALNVQLPGLIVQMAGHLRSFSGRAFVPEMIPQSVRAEEIR